MSDIEVSRLMNQNQKTFDDDEAAEIIDLDTSNLAESIDWRTKGFVTPVKDGRNTEYQWAFATTGITEFLLRKRSGKLQNLSEQQLMSCSWGSCSLIMNIGKALDYLKVTP